ncbi:hypothetical protein F4810DRAFT_482592 [Camillea tinctor]|nr:hypothetical protein F4810DRAFT_482592 [Camillea tinctor]
MGGPFALSVPGYKLGVHPHKHRRLDEEQRASRSPSPSTSLPDASSSYLPSDSINPLSHTPDTLRQFAVAGLSPEEELPSKLYPSFPHRPLPPEYPSGSRKKRPRKTTTLPGTASAGESGTETAASTNRQDATVRQHSARLKHLNTLTAIMHHSLHSGDIPRAKRALGLLVQTKEIDMRLHNLWAVGSEILMRSGGSASPAGSNADDDAVLPRWGTAAAVAQVRGYLEALIQQHPHDAQRPRVTSAVDFWPALLGIEAYSLGAELQGALYRLDVRGDAGSDEEEEEESRLAAHWAAKDAVRAQTQAAARALAARMDQVLEGAPYATHGEMLRLRGQVGLFIADLYLPARVVETGDAVIVERMGVLSLRDGRAAEEEEEDEEEEERLALRKRREEQEKARVYFQRIVDGGGQVDGWIRRFMDSLEEEHED